MAYSAIGRLFRCQTPSVRQTINSFTQKRCFSGREVPTFKPTKSPELDQTLHRFRDEVFIPNSLSEHQRLWIYRPRHAHKLNEHPITVTIGEDEQYRLRPIDKRTLPTQQDVINVLTLMHKTENWSNLPTFLAGLRRASMRLKRSRWQWLVRKAGEANGLGTLVECARQATRTGFLLKDAGLVKRLFFQLHLLGQQKSFTGKALTVLEHHEKHNLPVKYPTPLAQANGYAKQLTLAMEAPEHFVHDFSIAPYAQPGVIGVLLELKAAQALETGGEASQEAHELVPRLLESWKHRDLNINGKNWYDLDKMLQEYVPIYNGMKLALQLDVVPSDKPLYSKLKTAADGLGKVIGSIKKKTPKDIQEKPSIGLNQAQLLHED